MEDELQVLITETGQITNQNFSNKIVRPGCLGKLSGVIAEWRRGTRNGRIYTRKLWEKVFNTPWVQEALETKTLFGEADHPDERLESKLSEAAVVMTDYEFDDANEQLLGEFDILDTPSGRILRTLAEYGSVLGVSSRGRGKVIERGGEQVVEESSYLFGGFDIVALPAVQRARQDFVAEGLKFSKDDIHKSIEEQIDDCNTISELMTIKNILESSQINGLDKYLNKINERVSFLNNSDNTIVERLTDDLQKSYSEYNRLKSKVSKSHNTIDEDMDKENVKILKSLYDENSRLKSELVERGISSKDDGEYDGLRDQLENLSRKNLNLSKKAESYARLKETNESLEHEIASLKSKVRELSRKSKQNSVEYDSLIEEYNELLEEFDSLDESYEEVLQKYLKVKLSTTSGIDLRTAHRLLPENFTIDDIDQLVDSQTNLRRRMSKLPIAQSDISEYSRPVLESSRIGKNYSNVQKDDLATTRSMLQAMKGN